MSDPLGHFVRACQAINPAAAAAGFPPFAAAFQNETPLNSGPYIFDLAAFGATFGTSAHRIAILADAQAALDALRSEGMGWHLLLVGGSFIREGESPSDLDALVVYSLASTDVADVERAIHAIRSHLRRFSKVDFKFCPVDVEPIILVKRLLFFSNVFGYDKDLHTLSRGSVMVVPNDVADDMAKGGRSR
ncbi:DUF6932 family protein [Sphingomonas sp. HT-1]|uniref:DUF6932 family protein n=1 Tax=unclassified Sphingomonas TaxID=196159 RepID=UPI00031D8837|nr:MULTISPECIES: hypothetical protein [unclassified Sphingomonas]KTF69091.1 hypothetical protein ATB93_10530 [Sphingomonas sp. WG]